MPVPSAITDLSTTAGSNSPAGTESIGTNADDYIRTAYAFIAALRDGSKNTALGSAGAPAVAFTGDTNTGIFSPASDNVGIAAGGTEVVRFNATNGAIFTGGTGTKFGFGTAYYDAYTAVSVVNMGVGTTQIEWYANSAGPKALLTSGGNFTAVGLLKGNNGGSGLGAITVSTSAASGGSDGDLWFRVA